MPDFNGRIRKMLSGTEARKVLDIGGNAEDLATWRSIFPGAEFTVVNIDPKELPPASDTVVPVNCDAQDMPMLDDSTFDLAVSNQVLEHIQRPEDCLREILRVLRPNGTVLLTTPNLAAWYNRLGLLFGYQPFNYTPSPGFRNIGFPGFVRKNNIFDHPRVFTARALRELFGNVGFRVEKTGIINHTYEGQPYRRLRGLAHYLVPQGWRENIIVLARKPA